MSDTEALNLIEHYQWQVMWLGDKVHIVLHRAGTYAEGKNLREGIVNALMAQAKWSIG